MGVNVAAIAAAQPIVRAALEEAGWHPGYSFDASRWCETLRLEGFALVPSAMDFLGELGGLTITPPRRDAAAYRSGPLVVNPLWAASGEAERINQREVELGRKLTPVGEWTAEYIVLIAEDGTVFAETTFEVLRLGDDSSAALQRMIVADTSPERVR